MSYLTRKRLDVPEVADLLHAQARMLTNWADTEPDSEERRKLWQDLHRAGDALAERAYGGAPLSARFSYWIRPYDDRLDARVWRWNRPGPCRAIELTDEQWQQIREHFTPTADAATDRKGAE